MPKGPVRDGGRHSRRSVKGTSTWKKADVPRQHWKTECVSEFLNAEEARLRESHEWDQPPVHGLETTRTHMRDRTVDKFRTFASKFGGVGDLMKKLQIPLDGHFNLQQLSDKIKERNYDIYFSRDDQRLLFERLTSNPADGHVSVQQLALAVGEAPVLSSTVSRDVREMSKVDDIKHAIHEQVLQNRNNQRLEVDRKALGQQVEQSILLDPTCNGTVSEANLKYALGPQALDIHIPEEDQRLLLQEARRKAGHAEVNVDGFVRFLKIKDPSMDIIPLHDARSAYISRLKTKISNIDTICESPRLLGRIGTLTTALAQSASGTGTGTGTGTASGQPRNLAGTSGNGLSASASSASFLRPRTSSHLASMGASGGGGGFGAMTKSFSAADFTSGANSFAGGAQSPTTTSTGGAGMQLSTIGGSSNVLAPPASAQSPVRRTATNPVAYPPPDFSPTVAVSSPGSVTTTKRKKKPTRHRDPLDIMQEELELARTPRHEGTKRVPTEPTDWSRVGVGGDGVNASTGMFAPPEDQFTSQSMSRFSALTFTPGVGLTRDGVIGDAEKLFIERERKRNERYARTTANLQVTQNRLELEELTEEVKQLRRAQYSAQGMLRYSSNVYMRDLKELKRQPLQRMQRKPNEKLFRSMWGGTFHPAHHVDESTGGSAAATTSSASAGEARGQTASNLRRAKDFDAMLNEELNHKESGEGQPTVREDRDFATVYGTTYTREALQERPGQNQHQRPGTSIY